GTTDYTKISKIATAPSGASYLRIFMSTKPGSGYAYFDDAFVSSGEAPPEPTATPTSPAPTATPTSPAPTATPTGPEPTSTPTPIPTSTPTSAPTATPTEPSGVDNLAPNPSFENDPYEHYSHSGSAAFSWASDEAHEGSKSLKIISSVSSRTWWMSKRTLGMIPFTPGNEYTLTGWVKHTAGIAEFVIHGFNGNTWLGSSHSGTSTGNADWTELTGNYTPNSSVTILRLDFWYNGPGTHWVDDIVFFDASAASSPDLTAVSTSLAQKKASSYRQIFSMIRDKYVDLSAFIDHQADTILEAKIFDITGKEIKKMSAENEMKWDFTDTDSSEVVNGIYIYSVTYMSGDQRLRKNGNIILIR
ncbi:carbohydrate binding domain-containing protein, partial [Spirochaetota bacterium]